MATGGSARLTARAAGRFGKHPPRLDYRTLRLGDYLTPALPSAPASHDVVAAVIEALKLDSSADRLLFPMDGNDTLGDCTCAALAHAITCYRGLIGKRVVPTAASVEKRYRSLTGGPDTGLNELDVLNDWRKHPFDGDEILAYVAVDPKNHDHVRQAIALFGGVYLGFQVQRNAIADFQAHRTWTPGKLTPDGHAVYAVAYDADGVTVLTWGATQRGTWGWWDQCVDEAYAIVPPEAKSPRFCPGFDSGQLVADLAAVAS